MMLVSTNDTLQVVKTDSVATTAPDGLVAYVDYTATAATPGAERSSLSAAGGAVTQFLGNPAASTQRQVKYASIFNRDTVTHTFSVRHRVTGTDRYIGQLILEPNETAEWTPDRGWVVHDIYGFAKASTASSAQNLNGSYYGGGWMVGNTTASTMSTINGSMLIFPLDVGPGDKNFPGNMTVSSLYLALSGSQTATSASSTAASYTFSLGLYRYDSAAHALALVNSASKTLAISGGSDCTSGLHGPRWLVFTSGDWSTTPSLSFGAYFFGVLVTTAGTSKPLTWLGNRMLYTAAMSGFLGSTATSASSVGMDPFTGIMTTAGIPATINASQVNKTNASAGFAPFLALNNHSASF